MIIQGCPPQIKIFGVYSVVNVFERSGSENIFTTDKSLVLILPVIIIIFVTVPRVKKKELLKLVFIPNSFEVKRNMLLEPGQS